MSLLPFVRALAPVCLLVSLSIPGAGQVAGSASQGAAASQNVPNAPVAGISQNEHTQAEQQLKQEEQQRMLGVVPAFTAVYNGSAVPLSSGQKFRLALADGVDPFDFATSAVDAALEQQSDEFPEYGLGWTGYAKRFGASYADDFDGELWSEGILPSLLHQDPRYFRLGHGGFRRRLAYSLLAAVRARGDDGKWQFNTSNIGGNLIAGAISNAYYPAPDRGFGLTMQRSSIDIAEGLVQLLANEFYPDVDEALFHRHRKPAGAADGSAATPAGVPR